MFWREGKGGEEASSSIFSVLRCSLIGDVKKTNYVLILVFFQIGSDEFSFSQYKAEVRPYEYAELDVEVLERVGRCRGRKLC